MPAIAATWQAMVASAQLGAMGHLNGPELGVAAAPSSTLPGTDAAIAKPPPQLLHCGWRARGSAPGGNPRKGGGRCSQPTPPAPSRTITVPILVRLKLTWGKLTPRYSPQRGVNRSASIMRRISGAYARL